VGEALKRKRVAPFDHQNDRYYQALVARDLLRISRATETRFEVNGRLTNGVSGLSVGSHCLVRQNAGGDYEVLHGNVVVARLPAEAKDTLSACEQIAPSLNGIFPCRVTRLGAFGSISLEIDPGDDDAS
jgi:hypothetical protein